MADFSNKSLELGYTYARQQLLAKLRGIEHEITALATAHEEKPDYYPAYLFSVLQEFRDCEGFLPGWDLREEKHRAQ